MKIKLLFLLSILCFLAGCKDSDPGQLDLSTEAINIGGEEAEVGVTITSDVAWKVMSDALWCVPDKTEGANNGTLTLKIEANINLSERTAKVYVMSDGLSKTILVTQGAGSATEELHYKLPVIFHVLYKNQNDRNQYIDKGRLTEILSKCNELYRSSTDMNLEFVPATEDADGKTLEEPGVERILWDTPEMDCEKFMSTENPTNAGLIWNPKKYINVIVYTFSNSNILGISHMPYVPTASPLSGLTKSNYYLNRTKVTYPHSVSLNNKYAYVESTQSIYYAADVVVTLSHELGHYLGLFHVFSGDDDSDDVNLCEDSDYCGDTPSYNRRSYSDWFEANWENETYDGLVKRKSCDGTTFISRNIMDYSFCISDEFTSNQRERVRHVLLYSPLIPGPKRTETGSSQLRSSQDDEMPPIRVIK